MGHSDPAYAGYSGIVGNNFISNAWRVRSESTVNSALFRIGLGFGGRFGGKSTCSPSSGPILHGIRVVSR